MGMGVWGWGGGGGGRGTPGTIILNTFLRELSLHHGLCGSYQIPILLYSQDENILFNVFNNIK